MLWTLGITLGLCLYLWYGFARYAPQWMADHIDKKIQRHPHLWTAEEIRLDNTAEAVAAALLWPFYALGSLMTRAATANTVDSVAELHTRLQARTHRILELEHEVERLRAEQEQP